MHIVPGEESLVTSEYGRLVPRVCNAKAHTDTDTPPSPTLAMVGMDTEITVERTLS